MTSGARAGAVFRMPDRGRFAFTIWGVENREAFWFYLPA